MITKKEIMIRICGLETRVESLTRNIKRLQTKINKLDVPEEKKDN